MNPPSPVSNTLFARSLRVLANAVCRWPKWFLYPQFALFGLCIYYTAFSAHHVVMDMDKDNLVGSDKKYHQVFMKYRAEFPGEDELAVVVESSDQERNRQFVERLAAKLELETNLFTDVFYKGDLKALGRKALLFAPEHDLTALTNKLAEFRPFIGEFTAATNLDSLFNLVNQKFRTAKEEENAENNSLIQAIPALRRILELAAASLALPGTPVSPGITALFGAGNEAEREMYITFADGRIYLATARARSADQSEDAVKRMRVLMQETEYEVPGLNAGLTGEPVLDLDEMEQSQHDAILATIVALVVSALIFIYAYREIGRPLKTVLCLVIGLGYSMAFTTAAIGHLNILTITFAPILIGLAIDFGIHFITRYEEETRHGHSKTRAVNKAMIFTGQGIITGALTTATAFLAMGLTNFKGIQEMGIISGGGLVCCLVPMMTILPVLLMADRSHEGEHTHTISQSLDTAYQITATVAEMTRARIEEFWLQRPWWVTGVTGAFCVLAASQFGNVYFDYNLLDMQSKGLASVKYEKKLLFAGSSTFAVGDIKDWPSLAEKLTAGQEPVAIYVAGQLDSAARNALAKFHASGAVPDNLERILVENLNAVVNGPSIYDPVRFASVQLRPETAQLAAENPQGQTLPELNRLLLQDAFPKELTTNQPAGQSVLFAAIVADTLEQARQYEEIVKKLPSVASVDGDDKGDPIFQTLTSDQSAKLLLVREIKNQLAGLQFAPAAPSITTATNSEAAAGDSPGPPRANDAQDGLDNLATTLYGTMGYLDWAIEATKKDEPKLAEQLASLRDSITVFRIKMLAGGRDIPARLNGYQKALFDDIRNTFAALQNQDTTKGLGPEDLPPAIKNRFVGLHGKYRLLVFPKKDVWQRENQKEFIEQLRSAIKPELVTDTPVQLYEYETLLKDSYEQAALYALAAIAVMVWVHFRSLTCVVLSLLPVAIGTTWMVGLMGKIGIPFNPADIMTLPLVIGVGVTNGIHILNRFAEEQKPGILAKSTGKAVLVSGLTAMTGFGSLILGKHEGIRSLGLVMSIGIATCMLAGLTFLPALLNILVRNGWKMQGKKTRQQ